jgi:N6-adenosine-specific RNA methylase IME4
MSLSLVAPHIFVPPGDNLDHFLAQKAEAIRALARGLVRDAIEIGRNLHDVQVELARRGGDHSGRFLQWLEHEFTGWSQRSAYNFIDLYNLSTTPEFATFANWESLGLSGLYKLAAPGTPNSARVEVVARAGAGEHLKNDEVKAIIAQHGEQGVLQATSAIRAQKIEERRERARAAASIESGGSAGGTVEDLIRLARSGNRFGAILADPAWKFQTWSLRSQGRAPPYETMLLEEICALPVEALAAKDCALFFWVVRAHLSEALEVIRRWGFEFKTVAFGWFKGEEQEDIEAIEIPIGQGHWTRTGFEQCWLATRGNPRRLHADVREVIIEPRREHSRKPDCVHERIERLVAGPYLELFARRKRAGWTVWGNEVAPPVIPNLQEAAE